MQDKVLDNNNKRVASDFERGKGKRKMKTHFRGIDYLIRLVFPCHFTPFFKQFTSHLLLAKKH